MKKYSKTIKKLFFATLCACATSPALAQAVQAPTGTATHGHAKHRAEAGRFGSNWFVSAGGGAQMLLSDHDKQCKFGDRLGAALDVAVGKWFTSGFGARLTYSGLKAKGATQTGAHSTGTDVPGKGSHGYWLEKQEFNTNNLHADLLFNFSNLFWGHNGKRVWNVSPYIGMGWIHVGNAPKRDDVTANLGLLSTWRLCGALLLNLDIRGTLTNDELDGEKGGRGGEGILSATIGLTYRFKPCGWSRCKPATRYDNAQRDELRRHANELAAGNARPQ